jgi:hypothetical protein
VLRAGALAALVLLSGAAAEPGAAWQEIAWPFPRDAWPAGRAFRCQECGLEVYVRPKLGFCNCTSGVTGDAEVDAVSDVDMLSAEFSAPADGEPVRIGGLAGRARTYVVKTPAGTVLATGYALSSKCDLLVAVSRGRAAAERTAVVGLLESESVAPWIAAKLGLGRARIASR